MRYEFRRPLAIVTAVLFSISSAFPVVAAFVRHPESWPIWWGVLDVGLAFLLVISVFAIQVLARARVSQQAKDASYCTYRILTHLILVVLVLFFLAGDRIIWTQCLTGFAWLLLYALPCWFAALRTTPGFSQSSYS
jgi:hypothetical protein